MAKRLVHKVWFMDTGEAFPGSPFRGKAAFRRAMLAYYDEKGDRAVMFQLVDCANTRKYEVRPCINRCENPSLRFYYSTTPEEDEAVCQRLRDELGDLGEIPGLNELLNPSEPNL